MSRSMYVRFRIEIGFVGTNSLAVARSAVKFFSHPLRSLVMNHPKPRRQPPIRPAKSIFALHIVMLHIWVLINSYEMPSSYPLC